MTQTVDSKVRVKVLQTAKMAIDLKRMILEREYRRGITKAIHLEQYEETERDVARVVEGVIEEQIKEIASGLAGIEEKSVSSTYDETAKTLVSLAFNPDKWKAKLIDRMLPLMAIKMAEAATAQMISVGVDPRSKGARVLIEKHLASQHNQDSVPEEEE